MNHFLSRLSLFLLLITPTSFGLPSNSHSGQKLPLSQSAFGLDKQQPLSITSREAQYDQKSNTLTYEGEVKATQGNSSLEAQQVIVHFNQNNKIKSIQAKGNPVTYKTLTQRGPLKASANKIQFNPLLSTLELIDNAHVAQGGNTIDSPSLVIDIAKETVVSKPSEKGKTTIILEPLQRVKAYEKLGRSQRTDHHKTQTTTRKQRLS